MLHLAAMAALLGGGLCGAVGYHIQKFNITTLSFSTAHAALAGAAIALILGLDATYLAMTLAITSAVLLGIIYGKITHERELISMFLFSLFSAIALLSIYISNVYVLSTANISLILWGSLLAISPSKLIQLATITLLFTIYITAYRMHIDAIFYDQKLAEAEGINIQLHTLALLTFTGATIAFTLKLTGGFLIFSLLYNPVATAIQMTKNAKKQLMLSTLMGSLSAIIGLAASYILNWPIGATITLTSSTLLIIALFIRLIRTK